MERQRELGACRIPETILVKLAEHRRKFDILEYPVGVPLVGDPAPAIK